MTKRVKAGTSVSAAQERKAIFIEAYIANGRNATQAAITAGYSAKSARRTGTRLTADAHIASEIQRRTSDALTVAKIETGISVERTLREVARLSYVDLGKCFDEHGNALEINEIPDDVRAAIAGFEMVEQFAGSGESRQHVGYIKKFKFHDKNAALDKLMKHLGQYKEDNAQQPQAAPPMFVIVPVRARVLESK